ncbi:uncharacterized protein V1516DRAFT_691616 [Lipomyces oligophaga]|uniref:uncharacterized protein n=1 Tax=Lipomyces oligophaga TaxID=45792 RepID=UPI0034CF4DEE
MAGSRRVSGSGEGRVENSDSYIKISGRRQASSSKSSSFGSWVDRVFGGKRSVSAGHLTAVPVAGPVRSNRSVSQDQGTFFVSSGNLQRMRRSSNGVEGQKVLFDEHGNRYILSPSGSPEQHLHVRKSRSHSNISQNETVSPGSSSSSSRFQQEPSNSSTRHHPPVSNQSNSPEQVRLSGSRTVSEEFRSRGLGANGKNPRRVS